MGNKWVVNWSALLLDGKCRMNNLILTEINETGRIWHDHWNGMDDMVAPVIQNTRPHSFSFMYDKRMVTLYEITEEFEVTMVDWSIKEEDAICKFEGVVKFSMDNVWVVILKREEVHLGIAMLLRTHVVIFQEPSELPHERSSDHAINLIPIAQPFNLRPYKYSFDQKNSVESIINDILNYQWHS